MEIPSSTYRLQFSPTFTFKDAGKIVDYLNKLGISHIYASPVFKARQGSTHGYDVTDPRVISPVLGGEEGMFALLDMCSRNNIGWLQDIVPNHMALNAENTFLVDVMENGTMSRYYNFFDIDWDHPYEGLNGRVMIPVLGKSFGKCLEDGELQLKFDSAGLYVSYYDHWFPVKMESYASVFGRGVPALREALGDHDPDLLKFLGVLYTVKNLPETDALKERYVQIGFVKTMLWEIYQNNEVIRDTCDRVLDEYNGKNSMDDPWELFERVLTDQNFRLTLWKTATEELNYRRFFTVNDLIAVRVENDTVFRVTHGTLLDLVISGKIQGLRIDHIDGLYDPGRYCQDLRHHVPDAYIVVEKILSHKEELCRDWPIQGTTGYDFLNMVNELFCSRRGEKSIDRTYAAISEDDRSFFELVTDKKRLIIGRHMAGDIDNLALKLKELAGRDRQGIDITMYGLRRALVELLTFFPIYRTYVNEDGFSKMDREVLLKAIASARNAQEEYVAELDYIEQFLGLDKDEDADCEHPERRKFIMRLQQFTSPLLAKGIEDTALYTYNRLVSLNEVGGHPEVFGITVEEFHHFCEVRAKKWPLTMNATATHDTKRGEGTRARINVLSELGNEWAGKVREWHSLNRMALTLNTNGDFMPVMNDEYLFYQTVVGSYPFGIVDFEEYRVRVEEYMMKAVREAKVHSSWIRPNEQYENALRHFVHTTLSRGGENLFLSDFEPFQKRVAWYGMFNSLSQTTLKMMAPGVPDIYQGDELWDFSLVDPDNRRPVDFEERKTFLEQIIGNGKKRSFISGMLKEPEDGRIKLYLLHQLCVLRRRLNTVFAGGQYISVEVTGVHKQSIVAFLRVSGEDAVLITVPRMITKVVSDGQLPIGEVVWQDTAVVLPEVYRNRKWRNCLTGDICNVNETGFTIGSLQQRFPVAVMNTCED